MNVYCEYIRRIIYFHSYPYIETPTRVLGVIRVYMSIPDMSFLRSSTLQPENSPTVGSGDGGLEFLLEYFGFMKKTIHHRITGKTGQDQGLISNSILSLSWSFGTEQCRPI